MALQRTFLMTSGSRLTVTSRMMLSQAGPLDSICMNTADGGVFSSKGATALRPLFSFNFHKLIYFHWFHEQTCCQGEGAHLAIAGEGGVVEQEVGTKEEDDGVEHAEARPVQEHGPAEERVLPHVPEKTAEEKRTAEQKKLRWRRGKDACCFSSLHLYREGSLCSASTPTCCSTRLNSRMGREVKLMLYSVKSKAFLELELRL
ncbi:hypothetical protein EYF80_051919 [Liparis tanakae]|uniref:Uncharacterized protein n=1 Tax=Liparis tanakae TaxID=230148 RepID=A0A4Z2FC04_9TELE|nr:hypothetical protein EYF80_051919 [Liparis tanakae]